MLKVEGLMQQRCGMFDTPGVPHPHQLSAHLDPEEVQPLSKRPSKYRNISPECLEYSI